MSKNERKRTMVYSNVKKKADSKSASTSGDAIDLDNEVVIGLASFPKPNEVGKKNKNKKAKNKKSQNQKNQNKEVPNKKNQSQQQIAKKVKIKNTETIPELTQQEKIKLQKRRAIKIMSVMILMTVLLIGGIVYFLLSPVFNIKKIEVVNNKHVSTQEITSSSQIQINENMFKYSNKEIRKNLLANPYIESAKIKRNIFTKKIKLDVTERVATLMLEYGNSYVYIDNQGYILEISQTKLSAPILKGYVTPLEDVKPGNRLNKDDLERLDVVLNIIKNANDKGIANLITYIDIKDKKDYVMILESEDKIVYLGKCSDLSTQMLYVKEMIEREKNIEGEFYVDMDLNNSNPVFKEAV